LCEPEALAVDDPAVGDDGDRGAGRARTVEFCEDRVDLVALRELRGMSAGCGEAGELQAGESSGGVQVGSPGALPCASGSERIKVYLDTWRAASQERKRLRPESAVIPEFSAQRLARLESHLRGYIDDGRLAGVSARIVHSSGEAFRFDCGCADLSSGRKMTGATLCRVYSLSKPVTSVAAMMLFEEGRFLLTDPVAKYLPELGGVMVCEGGTAAAPVLVPPRQAMTVADLLAHTAGFGYGADPQSIVDQLYAQVRLFRRTGTIADMVRELGKLPLKFHPGERWEYGIAHDVLGRLLEVAAGVSFDRLLHERLFEPLGMHDTGFEVPAGQVDRLAVVYRPASSGAIEECGPEDTQRFLAPVTFFAGGEGLISTMDDFVRFAQMLLERGALDGKRYLSRKSVELMTRNHLTPAQRTSMFVPGYGFGLGFGVLVDPAAHRNLGSVGEFGWAGQANTYLWVDPVENFCAVLFAQFDPSSHYTVAREFKALLYQALL
jgi:CubicO group peptidase (beta-lactamase class C family)